MTVIAVLVSILLATVTSSLSKKFICGRVSFFCACHFALFTCNLDGSDMAEHVQSTSKKADVAAAAAAAAKKEVERESGIGRERDN
jgi:hypothetical protein